MKKIITLLLLILNMSCSMGNQESNETYEVPRLSEEYKSKVDEQPQEFNEPYEIKFQIDKVDGEEYALVVGMELEEGNKFISPHTRTKFKGLFNISLEKNNHLEMDNTFIETPRSVEELDMHPFSTGLVNWVRVNTTYQHKVKVLSKDDFDVVGMIKFVIEPRCTLEEIEFTISQRSGKLEIKNNP